MYISCKSSEVSSRKKIYFEDLQTPVISALSKTVLNEMKCVSSTTNATLLRCPNEELKHFSWDALKCKLNYLFCYLFCSKFCLKLIENL